MHTPSAIAARPLPKRTRSTAGLEEIDAWLGQITSSATNTTSSSTPSSTATSTVFDEPPCASTLGASRKRHHSLPAAAIAGTLQSLASTSSSSLAAKDKSSGSAATRRPELALYAGDSPEQQPPPQAPARSFSNQYSPSLLHHPDDAHALDPASYASFLPSASQHHPELPTLSTSSTSLSHQTHAALPPPLQLPEMSPREDFLVRAFVSDAMKLEGGGHEGDAPHSHRENHNYSHPAFAPQLPPRGSLEIPVTPTVSSHGGHGVSSLTSSNTTKVPPATPRTPSTVTGGQQHHKWTREEDEKLRDAVTRFGGKSWKLIAEMLGNGRTDVQCLHRWNKVLKPGLVKGPWTPEEDRVLLGLIARYGVGQIRWCDVALHLPGRIGKQCRERWCNHLDSSIRKGQWTPQEDDTVFRLQQTIGNKWSEIAKHLPGRTENAVKNRFNSAARRKWLMGQAGGGSLAAMATPTSASAGAKASRGGGATAAAAGGRVPRVSGRGGTSAGNATGLLASDLLAGPPRPPPQPPAPAHTFARGVAFGAMPATSFVTPLFAGFGDSDQLQHPHHATTSTTHGFHHPPDLIAATTTATTTTTPTSASSELARPAFAFHPGNAFPPAPMAFRTPFGPSTVASPSLASLTALLAEPTQADQFKQPNHDLDLDARHQEDKQPEDSYEPPDDDALDVALAMDQHTTPDDGDDNQVAHSRSVRRASLAAAVGVDKRRLSVDASSVGTSRHDTEDDDVDDDDASLRAIDLPESDAEGHLQQQQQDDDDDEHDAHGGGGSPVDMDDQNMSTFLDSVALELDDML